MAKVDSVGRWSVSKLEMLREYLAAYTSILTTEKNRKWCSGCHYVDAFAGSVAPIYKDSDDIINGSPLVALTTEPQFKSFTFIDLDNKRIKENINPLKNRFPNKKIETICDDANNAIINNVLSKFGGRSSSYRGFIFLDPYGLELQWNTVDAIGRNGAYDILVNFSVMGVVRQLGDNKPLEHMESKISSVFGTDEWKKISYRENMQCSLFETHEQRMQKKKENLVDDIVELYRSQLKTVFKDVSDAIIMRNSKNGPLYALILASHASVAVRKMHEIFKRHQKRKI